MRPEARTLGLTAESLALQARAAFFGAEVQRVQRGRDEVRVFVRLPADERNSINDVERYPIRTPDGAEVPLSQAASLDRAYRRRPSTAGTVNASSPSLRMWIWP